jgi:hypothetical protein
MASGRNSAPFDEEIAPTQSLEALMVSFAAFDCTVAHDLVYAILPMAADANIPERLVRCSSLPSIAVTKGWKGQTPHEFESGQLQPTADPSAYKVDYRQSVLDVCVDFISFALQRSRGKLDIICQHWTNVNIPNCPSWIQQRRRNDYREDRQFRRIYARSFNSSANPKRGKYGACGKTSCELSARTFADQGVFVVKGFILDSISAIESTIDFDVVPRTWANFCGWVDFTTPPPESFWRTIVADRSLDAGYNLTGSSIEDRLFCARAFQNGDFILNFEYSPPIERRRTRRPRVPAQVYGTFSMPLFDRDYREHSFEPYPKRRTRDDEKFEMYKNLVQATVFERAIFKTEEYCFIGIGNLSVRLGDM